MKACLSDAQITDFLADQLSNADEEQLLGHVQSCKACRARLDRETQIPESVQQGLAGASEPDGDPDGVIERIIQGVHFSPTEAAIPVRAEDTRRPGLTVGAEPSEELEWLSELPGYDLIEPLGRGGLGAVYKARQASLDRIVALKMLLPNATQKADLERFRIEAETVARLQHPNVVQVFDIIDVNGRPCLCMEHVDGGDLANWSAANPQPVKEAARIVQTLALAMQAVHENDVLHRDLKPANILLANAGENVGVALGGEDPPSFYQPKITDFGLAKLVDRNSGLTAPDTALGTPSYMSPEQARGKEVGVATDVYSLGAILYELLVGRPPFRGASAMETIGLLLHDDPLPPTKLVQTIPRDLEAVCLKCIEKEPSRRYGSAAELAADLDCWLKGKPTRARPATRLTNLGRWARRNPLITTLTGICGVLLLTLAIGGPWMALKQRSLRETAERETEKYREQKRRAEENRDLFREQKVQAEKNRDLFREQKVQAEANLKEARATINKYVETVENSQLLREARFKPVLKELLAEALEHYRRYIRNHDSNQDERFELAEALLKIGSINQLRGEPEEAAKAYDECAVLLQTLTDEHPGNGQYQVALAELYGDRADLDASNGDPDGAREQFEAALTVWRQLQKSSPAVPRYRLEAARILNDLGVNSYRTGRPAEAIETYRQAIDLLGEATTGGSAQPEHRFVLATSHHSLGVVHLQGRDYDEAAASLATAFEIRRGLAKLRPNNPDYQAHLAQSYRMQGRMEELNGSPDQAMDCYKESLALNQRLVNQHPTIARHRAFLAADHTTIGLLLQSLNKQEEANESIRQSLAIREQLVREYPTVSDYRLRLGGDLVNFGSIVRAADPEESLRSLNQAVVELRALLQQEPRHPSGLLFQRNAFWNRAKTHDILGRYAEAADDWKTAANMAGGRVQTQMRAARCRSLALCGKRKQALKLVSKLDLTNHDKASYDAACVYAVCAKAEAKAKKRGAAKYEQEAVRLLLQAGQQGFFHNPSNRSRYQEDAIMDWIRDRPELKSLGPKSKPPTGS